MCVCVCVCVCLCVTLITCTEVEAETMHVYYNLTISFYVRDCIQFGEILVDLHVMLTIVSSCFVIDVTKLGILASSIILKRDDYRYVCQVRTIKL